MKTKMWSLWAICSMLSMAAWAGNEVGNGGDVVACYETGTLTSIKLLDFHEAEVLRPELIYDLGDNKMTHMEKVHFALERLSRLDAKRALAYKDKANHFFDNTRFVTKVTLQDIPDSGYVPIAENCKILQIAIQKKPLFPEDRLYTISRELWDLLDEDHRAGLVLHEIIYGETIALGQNNSIKARYFASLVSSGFIGKLSQSEYDERVKMVMGDTHIPGPIHFTSPTYEFSVKEGAPLTINLSDLLSGTGSGNLQWQVDKLPFFLTANFDTGIIVGTPKLADVGTHQFRLSVTDGEGGAIALITINVLKENLPPVWNEDPIVFTAAVNQLFTAALSANAHDPDGDPLVFSVISGPPWAVISSNGLISGTPTAGNIGENHFTIKISDPFLSTTGSLIVTVK